MNTALIYYIKECINKPCEFTLTFTTIRPKNGYKVTKNIAPSRRSGARASEMKILALIAGAT